MIRQKLAYWFYEKGLRFYGYKIRFTVLGLLFYWHKPKVKFILFSQGRSGSTLLSDLLDSSPLIKSDGEVFGAGMPIRVHFPKLYLNLRMKSFRSPVYGCKIKIYDLEHQHGMNEEETKAFLQARFSEGWKIIHLRRTNKLRQALSSLVAEATATYHVVKEDGESKRPKVKVNVDELPHRLHWLKKYDQHEEAALEGFDAYEVNYERDLLQADRHQVVLDGLMQYLDLPKCKASTAYSRTSSDDLKDYIANYDEMVDVLTASGNEGYLSSSAIEQ